MNAVFTKGVSALRDSYSMQNEDGSGVSFSKFRYKEGVVLKNIPFNFPIVITKEEFMEAFVKAIELISIPTAAL